MRCSSHAQGIRAESGKRLLQLHTVRWAHPPMTLRRLRWVAILLPAMYVLTVELSVHLLLEPSLGPLIAHGIVAAMLILGIVAFSLSIFRQIETREQTIFDLYSQAQHAAERLEQLIESSGDGIIT